MFGSWFCENCLYIKQHFCNCGDKKMPHRSYCNHCATKRTNESRLRTGRIVNGCRKPPRKKIDVINLNNELKLFVEYIKEKGAIDFMDINEVFSIYEKLENMDLLMGLRDNIKNPSVESMWKVLLKLYYLEKNDFI